MLHRLTITAGSYYTLQWTSTPGLRYQVFRALDKSIFAADAGRGAGRRYQDSDYPTLTNRQLADLAGEFDNIYLIRTSVPVLGNTFKDELPGAGRTALYIALQPSMTRVCAVLSRRHGPQSGSLTQSHLPSHRLRILPLMRVSYITMDPTQRRTR